MSGDQNYREARHANAWVRYVAAERRELEQRRNGLLRKLMDGPLPGETPQEIEWLAADDEAKAREGIIELMKPSGEVYYKHIDDLIPEDRLDRSAAEEARIAWLTQRQRIRDSL
jgi:hypothetical protein